MAYTNKFDIQDKNHPFADSIIDLHIHTTASDGMTSPNEIVQNAAKNKLSAISITDHDTIVGIQAVLDDTISSPMLEIIPGVEFSATFCPVMHIIGLFIDIKNKMLQEKLHKLGIIRMRLISKAFRVVGSHGILITPQKVLNEEKAITIVNLKQHLIKNNLMRAQDNLDTSLTNILDEWKRYLPLPKTCISMIHQCKGLAILAHPKLLHRTDKELIAILRELKQDGLDGIEVIHPSHTLFDINKFMNLAAEFDLLCSGGSDYHGSANCYTSTEKSVPYIFLELMKQKIEEKKTC